MYQQTDLLDALAPGRVEDFITNAFCWLLSNTGFGSCFLKHLGSEGLELREPLLENPVWEVQTQFAREGERPVRPDMTCIDTDGKHGIIFEHKAWSDLHDGQLENYREHGEGPFREAPIVLITAHPGQHGEGSDLRLCWYQIHGWLEEYLKTDQDPVVSFVARNFCTLLKKRGLGPMEPLRDEVLRNYFSVKKLPEILQSAMRVVSGGEWPEKAERDVRQQWGRLGFHVRGQWRNVGTWNPGVFVGVLLDGWDHCTRPVCPEKGPDACVILSVPPELQPATKSPFYCQFVTDLKSAKEGLPPGWELYHHAKDDGVIKERYGAHKGPNPWHPFHVRRPLIDVLDGAGTAEAQADRFYADARRVVDLVLGCIEADWMPNA